MVYRIFGGDGGGGAKGDEQPDKYNLGMDTLLLGLISTSLNDKCCCNI